MPLNIKAKAREVYEHGFCVLESIFTPQECANAQRMLIGYWESKGRPAMTGWGFPIHPLLPAAPELAPQFAKAEMIDTMAEILRDDVRMMHTGSRMSNEQSDAQITWHDHYAWDPAGLETRDRIERLLGGCSITGTGPDVGPFIAYPRKLNDPSRRPFEQSLGDWPGQVVFHVPPGSSVIFDTAVWHTARSGTSPGIRCGWGFHAQGWRETRSHPEDNSWDTVAVREQFDRFPGVRDLFDRPDREETCPPIAAASAS